LRRGRHFGNESVTVGLGATVEVAVGVSVEILGGKRPRPNRMPMDTIQIMNEMLARTKRVLLLPFVNCCLLIYSGI
jgi:hypothetical protein